MLLWVSVCELGGQPAARVVQLRRATSSASTLAARGDRLVADAARSPSCTAPGAVARSRDSRSRPPMPSSRSTSRTPASARTRARGSGSGRRSSAQRSHGRDAGVDQRLGGRAVQVEVVEDGDVARPQARAAGPRYAGRRGRCRPRRRRRAWRRVVSFITASSCQPGRAPVPAGRGPGASAVEAGQARGAAGRLEQLPGVGQRGVGVLQPGEHPGQLALAARVVEHGQPGVVTEPSLDFSTTTCRSAYAATCGRWVTTRTWASRASRGQPAADLDRGLAADAGVDLVEDERRHRAGAGQRHLEGQHHPGQLAARGALVQRARLGAGVGGEQELDLVDARTAPNRSRARARRRSAAPSSASVVPGAPRSSSRACGIASRSSSAVTSSPSRAAAAVRAADSAAAASAERRRAGRRARARSASIRSSVSSRSSSRAAEASRPGQHLVDGVAVLAGQRGQRRPALGDARPAGPGRSRGREAYDATSAARSESR